MKVPGEAVARAVPQAPFAPGTRDVCDQGQLFLTPPLISAPTRSEGARWDPAAEPLDLNPVLAPHRPSGTPPSPCAPSLATARGCPGHGLGLCSFAMFSHH